MASVPQEVCLKILLDLASKNPPLIRREGLNMHILSTLEKCYKAGFEEGNENYDKVRLEVKSVVDYLHEELHTGHWSKVPITTRQNYTLSQFLQTILFVKQNQTLLEDELRQCLKFLDMGLLLGAPLEENGDLLNSSAKEFQKMLYKDAEVISNLVCNTNTSDEEFQQDASTLVEEETLPSLEHFSKTYFNPRIPVKLKGCMSHWPAMDRWRDVSYLLKMAGMRTVPVELGKAYTDDNWSQKLMTFENFIKEFYLGDHEGYLAQHNLFDQITELKSDIITPDYCCLGEEEPEINAWLGPAGTLTPLHQDPKHNILCQVFGLKYILLIPADDTPFVYPHENALLSNTSKVDPLKPDLDLHPLFPNARIFKCLLGKGEMLYIPPKWWHHVRGVEKSFSVSFWWK